MASLEGPEEGELETPQDELNEIVAEVDVLNDILGDSVGHDEFQEELENTEISITEEPPPEKPKASKPAAAKSTKRKAKKPATGKKKTPTKQPSKENTTRKEGAEEKKSNLIVASDSKAETSQTDKQAASQKVVHGESAEEKKPKDGKPQPTAESDSNTTLPGTAKSESTKKIRQDSGKSEAKSSTKSSDDKKSSTTKKVVKKTTTNAGKDEKSDGKKMEKMEVDEEKDAKKQGVEKVGSEKTSDAKNEKSVATDASTSKEVAVEKVSKEVKSEDAGSRKRKETKEKPTKEEGEPVDKKMKEKEQKSKEKIETKTAPKKDKAKVEKPVKKEKSNNKEKPKEETRAVDDKEYNLQDNKEDMQIIDDVEASTSDGSGLNEDDILSHAGSDIDDLSSMSGSFSRSKSPLSGRSRSRSRSASRGSSDSFERVEKAQKEKRRKRKQSSDQEDEGVVKSKISRALSESNKKALDEFLKGSRYFIIKSNNYENVALSKAKGVWSTPPANERKLNDAYKHTTNVILIFSVKESGRFQGYCRLASESRRDGPTVRWVLPPGFDRKILTGVFKVDWLNRHECLFANCTHLRNPWNENKEIKICRDGQEVEPSVGEALCRLFPPDEHVDLGRILRHRKPDKGPSSRPRSRHDDRRQRDQSDTSRHRRRRDSSGHRHRKRHSDDFERDGRSKYGVKKETLLHGSYADYIREFEKSRQLRQTFGAAAPPMTHYQTQPRYHRSIDPTTAAAEAFLSRDYTTRHPYRTRR